MQKFGFDTAENELCKVCPLSVYRSPRCESERKSAEFKNENLQYDQEQLTQKIERAEGQKAELEEEVQKTNTEKNETLALMEDAKMTRIAENSAFQQALKDAAYVFF